jgi:hypothetical protein
VNLGLSWRGESEKVAHPNFPECITTARGVSSGYSFLRCVYPLLGLGYVYVYTWVCEGQVGSP